MNQEHQHKKFDELFKQKMESHDMDGSDELWENVSGQFSELDAEAKRKRRFVFLRWFSLGLLVLLVSSIAYYELKIDALSSTAKRSGTEMGTIKTGQNSTPSNAEYTESKKVSSAVESELSNEAGGNLSINQTSKIKDINTAQQTNNAQSSPSLDSKAENRGLTNSHNKDGITINNTGSRYHKGKHASGNLDHFNSKNEHHTEDSEKNEKSHFDRKKSTKKKTSLVSINKEISPISEDNTTASLLEKGNNNENLNSHTIANTLNEVGTNNHKSEKHIENTNDNSVLDKTSEHDLGEHSLKNKGNSKEKQHIDERYSNEMDNLTQVNNTIVADSSLGIDSLNAALTDTIVSDEEKKAEEESKEKKKDKNKPKIKQRFSGIFFVSPNFSYRRLTENPENTIPGTSLSEFNKLEKGAYGYTGGFNLNYALTNSFSLYSGLQYTRYRQHFNSDASTALVDTTNGNYTLYTSLGAIYFNETDIDEPGEVEVNGNEATLSFQSTQRISILSIPLGLQYGFDLNKKGRLFIQSGLNLNFLVGSSTKLNLSKGEGGSDGADGGIVVKGFKGLQTLNLGGSFGIGYEYELSKNIWFTLNPVFRTSFTSVSEKNGVKSYPYSLGLNTGIRIKF